MRRNSSGARCDRTVLLKHLLIGRCYENKPHRYTGPGGCNYSVGLQYSYMFCMPNRLQQPRKPTQSVNTRSVPGPLRPAAMPDTVDTILSTRLQVRWLTKNSISMGELNRIRKVFRRQEAEVRGCHTVHCSLFTVNYSPKIEPNKPKGGSHDTVERYNQGSSRRSSKAIAICAHGLLQS